MPKQVLSGCSHLTPNLNTSYIFVICSTTFLNRLERIIEEVEKMIECVHTREVSYLCSARRYPKFSIVPKYSETSQLVFKELYSGKPVSGI